MNEPQTAARGRCEQVCAQLARYLAGDIAESERASMAAHLESCAACREQESAERELNRVLRLATLQDEEAARLLQERIRARMNQAPSQRRWRVPVGIAAALVAGIVVTLGASNIYGLYSAHRLCSDAAEDHEQEVVQQAPLKWVASASDVMALVNRLGGGMALPAHIGSYGFQRARICELGGRRFVHAVYAGPDREFSVFLGPQLPSTESEIPNMKMVRAERLGTISVAEYHGGPTVLLIAADNTPKAVMQVFDLWSASK